ncbi:MAG: hypothetical protein NVV74_23615 [Magnetospirillum sp.]|nr:hypothetical protein [Magnetospirillum sp.]
MRVSDTALLEDGVLTAYREDWLREPAVAPTLVLRRPGALLVGVGICVLRASARAVDYWPAGAAAVARSTDPSRIGLPLSFVRHGGEVVEVDGTRWQVAESSADEPLALLDGGAP